MFKILKNSWALFIGLGFIMTAHGLQGNLLGVRSVYENFSLVSTGLIMSGFYIGYFIGAKNILTLVHRVGHIRVFAAMASSASLVILVHSIYVHPFTWFIARIFSGICMVGIYTIVESWLNDRSTNQTRGKVLSIYMMISYFGMGLGMLLINFQKPENYEPFILISILMSLSLVPILLTKRKPPAFKKIQDAIKNQSVPFIYERMGEQYNHFFIDEFQDTSSLQWDNLKPLLENAVVSEDEKGQRGSLLLVGDAKQSIYRWRGGNAEQFIDLYENKAFPAAQPKVINLPNNFRSLFEIVQFNNRFFNYTAAYLERENFASLYRDGSHQKPQKESGGFVSLEFLDDDPDKEAHYCEKVLDAINASLDKGFSFGDICLLTRKKKHGVLLAQYLIEKQIPVISSESLLLDNHPKVRFLVQLIRFVYQETTPYQAYPLLAYLAQTQNKISVHEYIKKSLGNASEFFKSEFGFNPEALNTASIYDFCLMGIRSFSLANGKDAYLQFFLDVVSEVSLKEGGGPSVLLQYWEQKKSQLSVSAPDGLNAIQILTVHKAKGLEFPVVIFPFAETPLKEERNPTFWLPVPKEDFDGFEYLLLAKNDKIAQYNPLSKQIIEEEDQRLVLDALNILYVALTRASQALFVIGGMALNKDGKVNKNQYSGLLIDYLMDQGEWSAEKQRYTFGHFKMPEETTAAHKNDPKTIFFQLTQNTHERYALLMHPHTFVPEKVLQAQNLGQQLHYLLEQLDIHPLEKSLEKTSKAYPSADLGSLKTQAVGIISHEHLEKYYQKGLKAFNEKDIFTQNGSVARPDRLVFNENKVTVIDYKTGVEKEEDQVQIKSYGALLEEMGYQVENKILVYVDGARVLPIFV